MITGQSSARLPIRRDRNACAGEEKCVPFQVGTMKGSRINFCLILPEAPECLLKGAIRRSALRALWICRYWLGAEFAARHKTYVSIGACTGTLRYLSDCKVSG